MKVQNKSRILRLGGARRLTRAVVEGEYAELNSHFRFEMPLE